METSNYKTFKNNRKNDKKKMIWSFVISLIMIGIGSGLVLVGALDFHLHPSFTILWFICIEKDYDYWEASVERLEREQAQLKLF